MNPENQRFFAGCYPAYDEIAARGIKLIYKEDLTGDEILAACKFFNNRTNLQLRWRLKERVIDFKISTGANALFFPGNLKKVKVFFH